jgi:hypothetical protein
MNVNQILTFDNFLDDPNLIREQALLLNYSEPQLGMGWKGYRCLEDNELSKKLTTIIRNKLSEKNSLFNESILRCYFHYTINKEEFDRKDIHKDSGVDYAGVIYLTPNPLNNSGTSFYDDRGNEIMYLENIYNRFVFYPANEWHSLKESFGDSIENGRLTFTIFCTLNKKNIKSLL